MQSSTTPELTHFAEDVLRGLSETPKSLSSKYFYDDEGSRLFQEIMKLPEYYLTGCEKEIFSTQTDAIYRSFAATYVAVFSRLAAGNRCLRGAVGSS